MLEAFGRMRPLPLNKIFKKMETMLSIVLSVLGFIVVMTLILTVIPKDRILLIAEFFVKVLPRIPITGIIEVLKRNKESG